MTQNTPGIPMSGVFHLKAHSFAENTGSDKLGVAFELTIDNGGIRFADDYIGCFAPLVPPL